MKNVTKLWHDTGARCLARIHIYVFRIVPQMEALRRRRRRWRRRRFVEGEWKRILIYGRQDMDGWMADGDGPFPIQSKWKIYSEERRLDENGKVNLFAKATNVVVVVDVVFIIVARTRFSHKHAIDTNNLIYCLCRIIIPTALTTTFMRWLTCSRSVAQFIICIHVIFGAELVAVVVLFFAVLRFTLSIGCDLCWCVDFHLFTFHLVSSV